MFASLISCVYIYTFLKGSFGNSNGKGTCHYIENTPPPRMKLNACGVQRLLEPNRTMSRVLMSPYMCTYQSFYFDLDTFTVYMCAVWHVEIFSHVLHILPDGAEVLSSSGEVIGKQQISLLTCTTCMCVHVCTCGVWLV